jgi:prophage tail gpP-like protein
MTLDRKSPIEANNLVSLEVDGVRYEGWKSVRISQGIEQLAGTFSLEVTQTLPDQAVGLPIECGAACTLKVGPDVMITGYVDVVSIDEGTDNHTIRVEGRDRTGDLVDCSAPSGEWTGLTFEYIAAELIKPFNVELLTQVETSAGGYVSKKPGKGKAPAAKAGKGGGRLPRKGSNSGETVHKLLEKLAKIQGVLLVSDRRGGLVVTRAGLNGRATDMLALERNLKSPIQYERSFANLYSEITVKGQAHGATGAAGAPVLSGAASVKPVATVKRGSAASPGSTVTVGSKSIQRYRPLIINAEDQADAKRCQDRAQWEAGTREARSKKFVVQVQGWRQSDGSLWEINTLTNLKCNWVGEDEDMLISNIEYSLDLAGGTVCIMTLYSPEAYDVLKEIPKVEAGKGGGAGSRQLSGVSRGR